MLTRTARVGLNTAANIGRFVVSLGVVFFLTPFIIREVGNEDFGLWTLTFSTLGFLGLLDLGFGSGIVKYVAECRGTGDTDRRNRMLSTLGGVYLLLAVVSLVLVAMGSLFYADLFGIAQAQRGKALSLLWILAARNAFFGLPLSLFRGILFGEQLIWQINLVQTATSLLMGVLAWGVLRAGGGIIGLAWLNLGLMLLEHLAYFLLCRRQVDRLELSPRLADRTLFREALSFSAATFVVSVSSLILLRTDPIIISFFLPLSSVAVYAIALKIVENAHLLSKQFINVTGPLIAELKGQGDEQKIRFILINSSRFALLPSLSIGIPLVLFAPDLLRLWVGSEYAAGAGSLVLLTIAMTLAVPQMIASNVLTMTGREGITARAAMASAVINLGISLLLVRPLGLEGVALGTLAATVLVDVLWVPRFAAAAFGMGCGSYWRRIIGPLALPVLLDLAVTWGSLLSFPPTSLLAVALEAIPGALVLVVSFWVTGMEPSEKQLIREKLLRFRKTPGPAEENP